LSSSFEPRGSCTVNRQIRAGDSKYSINFYPNYRAQARAVQIQAFYTVKIWETPINLHWSTVEVIVGYITIQYGEIC